MLKYNHSQNFKEVNILKEKRLVTLLAKYYLSKDEENELNNLMAEYLNWGEVLGHLMMNRVMGIAWATIEKFHLNNEENTNSYIKFIPILKEYSKMLTIKQNEQMSNMMPVYNDLNNFKIEYGALKGLALQKYAYNMSIPRDFNDNDVLINLEDSAKVSEIVKKRGYLNGQKDYVNSDVKESDRKKIIIRTMVTHELYPFIKKIKDSFIDFHIIDFQFSLELYSSKRTTEIVKEMLSNRKKLDIDDSTSFYALDLEDTLIFTMLHYYKEAIYELKILNYKDLALYKICDIHFLLNHKELDQTKLISRIKKYSLSKACYYAWYHCNRIFDLDNKDLFDALDIENKEFVKYYYSEDHMNEFLWNEDYNQRIFDYTRANKVNNQIKSRNNKI